MKFLATLTVLLALLVVVQSRKTFESRFIEGKENSYPTDWSKALNNLISVGLFNLRQGGEFLTLYPFSNLDRVPDKNYCSRQLNFDPTEPSKFKGTLARVYNSGVLRIGVTSLVNLPFFSATPAPQGFFFDLGNSLANEIGFILKKTINATFTVFPTTNFFANATSLLAAGTVDTIIGTTYTVARSTLTDYSCWYETPSPFAVYRDPLVPLPAGFAEPTGIAGWNSPQIKVGTLAGSVFENAVNRFLPLAQKVFFPTMNAAYSAVGVTTDIVFSIIGETEPFAIANNNKIVKQPGTTVVFGGGNAFITHRIPAAAFVPKDDD